MKAPTNVDVIDKSWSWLAGHDLYWDGDKLTYDMPNVEKMTFEQIMALDFGTKKYQPLREHTALFIEFAHTPTTKAGILDFARRYGDLMSPSNWTKAQWSEAIERMRKAVELWRAIEGDENMGISRNSIQVNILKEWPVILGSSDEDKSTVDRSEMLDRCRKALWVAVNSMLRKYATVAQLALTVNGDYQLTFRPQNLLGALWLQCAQAIAHNYTIRLCAGCGKPFQAGAGTNRRADAKTCKDSCRQLAYRNSRTDTRKK